MPSRNRWSRDRSASGSRPIPSARGNADRGRALLVLDADLLGDPAAEGALELGVVDGLATGKADEPGVALVPPEAVDLAARGALPDDLLEVLVLRAVGADEQDVPRVVQRARRQRPGRGRLREKGGGARGQGEDGGGDVHGGVIPKRRRARQAYAGRGSTRDRTASSHRTPSAPAAAGSPNA